MKKIIDSFRLIQIVSFVFIFIILTILGTFTHELSHYVVAERFGFKPIICKAYVYCDSKTITLSKDKNIALKYLLVTIAGPLQTILTGTISFIILLYRKYKLSLKFKKLDWLLVFLSLFWSRQCFNAIIYLINFIFFNNFSTRGDEVKISLSMGSEPYLLNSILFFLGLIVCSYVVFVLVPWKNRCNLIVGGFLGSLIGYFVWLN